MSGRSRGLEPQSGAQQGTERARPDHAADGPRRVVDRINIGAANRASSPATSAPGWRSAVDVGIDGVAITDLGASPPTYYDFDAFKR